MVIFGDSLISDQEYAKAVERVNEWTDTLPSFGLEMKTGLMVDFRSRDVLRNNVEEKTAPLFYSQHIKDGKVVFPIRKDNNS